MYSALTYNGKKTQEKKHGKKKCLGKKKHIKKNTTFFYTPIRKVVSFVFEQ